MCDRQDGRLNSFISSAVIVLCPGIKRTENLFKTLLTTDVVFILNSEPA